MSSIAIIGASIHTEKFGNKAVRVYKKLGWVVYPINPKEKEIENTKAYASINDLPEKPDRISIYLPPQITLKIIPELKEFGVKEVILNPGTESDELIQALKENSINPIVACSIRMTGVNPDNF